MKSHYLIIDADEAMIALIEKSLKRSNPSATIEVYPSADKAMPGISGQTYDIAFIDPAMPGFNPEKINDVLTHVSSLVLMSNDSRVVKMAFDLKAMDFLLKPFSPTRLITSIIKKTSRDLTKMRQTVLPDQRSFFVKHKGSAIRVFESDIYMVEGQADYVKLHTFKGQYLIHSTMKKMEHLLGKVHFIRVHKSFLVRLAAISAVERTKVNVNNTPVPLSRNYKKALFAKLKIL
jgi:DNA-binding LytR/AlgR family response regulator